MRRSRLSTALASSFLAVIASACAGPRETPPQAPPSSEVTEYHGGRVFTGERFVEASLCVAETTLVACDGAQGTRVDLEGGYVIPPLADAHTHHFDGPYTVGWQRQAYLEAGVFYALTLTAPTRGVLEIRDRLSGPKNVDVASSLGGITGPDSHPAEIYEALALGARTYEEQVARAAEIRASRRAADDAYYVVETTGDVDEKWALLSASQPDIVKVFLRSSERYDEGYGKWGPGGGIDPQLLPRLRELASEADLRLAVANSSVADFRASLAARADLVTHLPCYQDSMSDPESPYYAVDTPQECLLEADDARAAALIGMGSVLITSEWSKDRPPVYVEWEKHNVGLLEAAGAPLGIGSNAYGSTVVDGLVAGAEKGFFPPARLLRLATRDTARLIFPDRELGCLEPGCEASFLVLDGNPIEDFSRVREIRLRVKDGEVLSPGEIAG